MGQVVDGDDGICNFAQTEQTGDLVGSHDLVGDQDVPDAGLGHDLGLAELGAGHADRAGGDRTGDDRRRLVALDMGAPMNTVLAAGGGDTGDIRIEVVEIDEQRRRVERRQRCRQRHIVCQA